MSQDSHHIVPIRTLAAVFGVLVALTIVTVVTAQFDLGSMNIPLALAIAGGKAVVVAAIFMALRYDNPVNMIVITLGIVVAVIFLTITLSDTAFRGALDIQERGYVPFEVAAHDYEADDHGDAASQEVEAHGAAQEGSDPDATDDAVTPEDTAAVARSAEELFVQYCQTCHSLDGTALAGPTLEGIGQARSFAEIEASILEPDAIVVEGFPPQVMQLTLNALGFYAEVSDAEIAALAEFLHAQQ